MVHKTKLEMLKLSRAMDKSRLDRRQMMATAGYSHAHQLTYRRATINPLQWQKYRQLLRMRGHLMEPWEILNHNQSRKSSTEIILEIL